MFSLFFAFVFNRSTKKRKVIDIGKELRIAFDIKHPRFILSFNGGLFDSSVSSEIKKMFQKDLKTVSTIGCKSNLYLMILIAIVAKTDATME